MNKERVLELADSIENGLLAETHGVGFNMHVFHNSEDEQRAKRLTDHTGKDCGTVACIAGWCHILYGTEENDELALVEALDIYSYQADAIALGSGFGDEFFYATNEQAANLLRDFAETGEVDWEKALGFDHDS